MTRWSHLCVAMLFISVEVRAVPSEVLFKDGQAFSKSIAFQDQLELNLDFGNSSDYVPHSEFNITVNGLILKFVGKEHGKKVLLDVTAVFGDWSTSPARIRAEPQKLVVYADAVQFFAKGHAHASAKFPAPRPIFFPEDSDVLVSLTSTSSIPKSLVISYDPLVTTTVEPAKTTQEPVVTTTVEPDQEEEEEPTVSISEQTPEGTDEPDEEEEDAMSSTFEPTVLEPTVSTPKTTTTKKPATTSNVKTSEKPTTTSSAKTTPEKPAVTEPPPTAAKLEDQKKRGKLEPNKLTYLILLGVGLIGITGSAILIALVSADKLFGRSAARDGSKNL